MIIITIEEIGKYSSFVNPFRDGLYPIWNSSIDVYEGAEHNLPDQAAMTTAQRIRTMISDTMCTDDILLVLISGKVLHTRHE
jgi:hypothetical protein